MSLYEVIKQRLNADIPSPSDRTVERIRKAYLNEITSRNEVMFRRYFGDADHDEYEDDGTRVIDEEGITTDMSSLDIDDTETDDEDIPIEMPGLNIDDLKIDEILEDPEIQEIIAGEDGKNLIRMIDQSVQREYKKNLFKAELYLREAIESRAEGQEEYAQRLTESANTILTEDSQNYSISEIKDTPYYKRARALYEIITVPESRKRASIWDAREIVSRIKPDNEKDARKLKPNEFQDILYCYLLNFVDYRDGFFSIREITDGENSTRQQLLDRLSEAASKNMKGQNSWWDPLANEIVAVNQGDADMLSTMATINQQNLRLKIERLVMSLDKISNTQNFSFQRKLNQVREMDSLFKEISNEYIRRYREKRGEKDPDYQEEEIEQEKFSPAVAGDPAHKTFREYIGKRCYEIVEQESKRTLRGQSDLEGMHRFFEYPYILNRLLELGVESYSAVAEYDFYIDFPHLGEMLAAVSRFNVAMTNSDARVKQEITRLGILLHYQELYKKMCALQDEKKEQLHLDFDRIHTHDESERNSLEARLAKSNKRCLRQTKDIHSTFKKLKKLIRGAPDICQLQYQREMLTFLAVLRRNEEKSRQKLADMIDKRGSGNSQIKSLLTETMIMNRCARMLEPDVTKEQIEAYDPKRDLIFDLKEIFESYKEDMIFTNRTGDQRLAELLEKIDLEKISENIQVEEIKTPEEDKKKSHPQRYSHNNGITLINLLPPEYRTPEPSGVWGWIFGR